MILAKCIDLRAKNHCVSVRSDKLPTDRVKPDLLKTCLGNPR
jgi:hypothetical protein